MKNAASKFTWIPVEIRRLSRKWKIILGGTTAVVVMATAIGEDTQSAFIQGARAYQKGNCGQAITSFAAYLSRTSSSNDRTIQAAARIAECKYYQALPEATEVSISMVNAQAFTTKYPGSPLGKKLQTEAVDRLNQTTIEQAVTVPMCDRRSAILYQAWLPTPKDTHPRFGAACGQLYNSQAIFDKASTAFEDVLKDYPNHSVVPLAEKGYISATIGDAQASNAGELPAPASLGPTIDGETLVIIANGSPETLRLIFDGPEPRFEEIPPCEDCKVYAAGEEPTCPETLPMETYRILPGDYQVLARSIGSGGVTPFMGEWSLAPGTGYSQCFFIYQGLQQPDQNTPPEPFPLQPNSTTQPNSVTTQ